MNRISQVAAGAHDVLAAAPLILSAITVSSPEDIIRGVIAVAVVGAIIYQSVTGGSNSIDPWLQFVASSLIGYYFGLGTKEARAVIKDREGPQKKTGRG